MKTPTLLRGLAVLAVLGSLLGFSGEAPARATGSFDPAKLVLRQVLPNTIITPVLVTHAGDDSGRLFIVDETGRIFIVKNGVLLGTPFLDIHLQVLGPDDPNACCEQGLLALAFSPQYVSNGRFFVVYNNNSGDLALSRFSVSAGNPDVANSAETPLLTVPHPTNGNHNGGTLAFGPNDRFLYWTTGDGGGGDDVPNNAQNLNSRLGKILRLDVSGATYTTPDSNPFDGDIPGLDEIWAYGLRNPWRVAFDRTTGDLFIGDVGQGRARGDRFPAGRQPGRRELRLAHLGGQLVPASGRAAIHMYVRRHDIPTLGRWPHGRQGHHWGLSLSRPSLSGHAGHLLFRR